MSRIDFDLYKKEFDNIKLSDIQKEKLKSDLLKSLENSENTVSAKPKRIVFIKTFASVAAAIVIILSLAFAFSLNSQENLKDFSVRVCLENNADGTKTKAYEIKKEKTIIADSNNEFSLNYNNLAVTSLEFLIDYSDINSVEINSQKGNIIGITYSRNENDIVTDMTSSHQKLNHNRLSAISKLCWIPSEENIIKADKNNLKEYLSDTVSITVIYSNKEKLSKDIEITFDNKGNYVASYKNK